MNLQMFRGQTRSEDTYERLKTAFCVRKKYFGLKYIQTLTDNTVFNWWAYSEWKEVYWKVTQHVKADYEPDQLADDMEPQWPLTFDL